MGAAFSTTLTAIRDVAVDEVVGPEFENRTSALGTLFPMITRS
jgi:hypothetical protein